MVVGGTVFLQAHGPLVCTCFCRVVGQVSLSFVFVEGFFALPCDCLDPFRACDRLALASHNRDFRLG